MAQAKLSIGELAARGGISASAIRYYERRGILPTPERVGGRRRYPETAVRRLGIIAAGKRAGFSLEEVGLLLTAADRGEPVHEQLRPLARRKLAEVDPPIERA